jgi:hypothetical protein
MILLGSYTQLLAPMHNRSIWLHDLLPMRHQKSQIEAGLVTPLPLKVEQVGKGNMVVPRPLAIR